MLVSRRGNLQGTRAFSRLLLYVLAKKYLKKMYKINTLFSFCKEILLCIRDSMKKARKGLLRNAKFGSNWYHGCFGSRRPQSQGMRRGNSCQALPFSKKSTSSVMWQSHLHISLPLRTGQG